MIKRCHIIQVTIVSGRVSLGPSELSAVGRSHIIQVTIVCGCLKFGIFGTRWTVGNKEKSYKFVTSKKVVCEISLKFNYS